jgi:sigma-B regulation protein RsbU (phosphoserine phosphatase)
MDTDSIIANQQREIEDLRDEVTRLKDLATSRQEPVQNSKTRQQPVDLIMENSNAVLFRRLAARHPKKRKMVYVSPNISRFGYAAEAFISGEVMFRDLVYHKDSLRTLKEIQEFTEQGIEVYKQNYRIVTKWGEVRWVEDRTSVYEDVMNGLRYHQGIVIDIHDRKTIEEKLKKSEEKHRRVIETTAEGFLFLDNDFVTADLNLAYE